MGFKWECSVLLRRKSGPKKTVTGIKNLSKSREVSYNGLNGHLKKKLGGGEGGGMGTSDVGESQDDHRRSGNKFVWAMFLRTIPYPE